MLNRLSKLGLGFIVIFALATPKVLAHGSIINYQETKAVEIDAKFDDGKPMASAQIVIYSPSNSTQPWLTGMTDDNGKFIFTPDFSQGGNWTIKVTSAGHGTMIDIPINSIVTKKIDKVNSSQPSSFQENNSIIKSQSPKINSSSTMMQKLVMAVTGVWGFVGTALFFSRKKV